MKEPTLSAAFAKESPLAGWSISEPDNWCLDEDCAALGIEFLPNYSAKQNIDALLEGTRAGRC